LVEVFVQIAIAPELSRRTEWLKSNNTMSQMGQTLHCGLMRLTALQGFGPIIPLLLDSVLRRNDWLGSPTGFAST
jgi:hypothetical protein